jgi:uncharacterized membrane protein
MKRPSVHVSAIIACLLFVVAAVVASPARPGQGDWTFIPFDVPGSNNASGLTNAFPLDINARGDIVGRYAGGGLTHGFLRTADGTFVTIDYPGAPFTVAGGINSEGVIVAWYAMAAVPGPLTERHGFLFRDGEFIPFDTPGSVFTNPLGINPAGDVVGRFCTAFPCGRSGSGNYHGFRWRDGEAVTIDPPNARETNAWKISADGDVVGSFREAGGPNRLFLLQGDLFTLFDLPGALPITQDNGGLNTRGDIVGTYCDAAPCELTSPGTHGFLLRLGQFENIDYPGAAATAAIGINASGHITGAFRDASGTNHGYILTGRD